MTGTASRTPGADLVSQSPQEIKAAFINMLSMIPDAEDDDGTGIIARILVADTWEDMNVGDGLPDSATMIGKKLKVTRVVKRESDIADGLPFYLIIDSINTDTGELVRWQTSSQTIVAQLVSLHMRNMIPALVEVHRAETATRGGFFPHDLKILAAVNPGQQETLDA